MIPLTIYEPKIALIDFMCEECTEVIPSGRGYYIHREVNSQCINESFRILCVRCRVYSTNEFTGSS